MTPLKVIVVPPYGSAGVLDDDGLWHVILGDCVEPGFVLQRCEEGEQANERARWWAKHYDLPVYSTDLAAHAAAGHRPGRISDKALESRLVQGEALFAGAAAGLSLSARKVRP